MEFSAFVHTQLEVGWGCDKYKGWNVLDLSKHQEQQQLKPAQAFDHWDLVQSTAKGIARRRRSVWMREAPQLLPLPGIMVGGGALVLFLGVFGGRRSTRLRRLLWSLLPMDFLT